MKEKIILVTGAAGFIGFHLCKRLLEQGCRVIGLDNLNGYYSVQLKLDRLKQLGITEVIEGELVTGEKFKEDFQFIKLDLENRNELPQLFEKFKFTSVCNLAAQAGVRYSIENPNVYIDSNIVGFTNLLECMRHAKIKKLVYASSSSVYGNAKKTPFETIDTVDEPISLYAATKKSNELMAYTYSHLYNIQTIGLRFFTVYGPWGRPDMAMFLFTDAILNDKPIKVFNNGNLSRDFTYIEDIIKGVEKTLLKPQPHNKKYSLYNIGNGDPVKLLDFIKAIEKETGKRAKQEMLPMQAGDVEQTWADTNALENDYNYTPSTTIHQGVYDFVKWFEKYYS
ncbi:NAD-dependent epimerase/dehydratase family protein [Mesonia sp. K4-1]|uniref:NAD-dependent epimerase/dehydratase family protein n=1 Tax=Mesonia sp. K4-1 TaxID=2602760 RepID=UPI0011C9CF9D|nr:NAD-dependent epimerase/dehydratase family protein [Mesonia sp. K4-1]TXK77881.1 NAD-dependent epimerase/dehydratase family protein [Mesonia sp. K4-1]